VPSITGIGIDLEDVRALDRFGNRQLQSFLDRWFSPRERAWCLAQPALRTALVTGICCKEAAYKALGKAGTHLWQLEVELASEGVPTSATLPSRSSLAVALGWTRRASSVLAIAIAGTPQTLLSFPPVLDYLLRGTGHPVQ
jgi:phosphopantetheinyl transferase (holo-ACP synthase)